MIWRLETLRSSTASSATRRWPRLDQLNGQLALADAAVAENEDAFTVNFHQHAVAGDAGSQFKVQHTDEAAHHGAGRLVGAQQGYPVLFCKFLHLREGFQLLVAAEDDGRRLLAETAGRGAHGAFPAVRPARKFISARPMICKRSLSK